MSPERGGIITGWLIKLVVSLAIFGLFAFEAGAVVVARVTIETVAGDAAGEAAGVFGREGDVEAARDAASAVAKRQGAVLESFEIIENGDAVLVVVSKRAKTLLLHRVGFAEDWAIARSSRRRGVS